MPLNAQQSRYILTQEGYDPDKYDVDEFGNVSDKISEPNPIANQPTIKNDAGISVAETAKRGITQSILPTLGSIAGGAAAGALGGSLAGPVGSVIGGIGGALAGGYGAGKLQESLVPDQIKNDYFLNQANVQANPITAAVSQFAPSLLAFNPVKGVTSLAGAVRKLPEAILKNPNVLRDVDVMALKNAGLGAGIGGGIDLGSQALGDQPFNLPQFLSSVVGGGVLNSPYNNRLNKAVGLHPIPEDPISQRGYVPEIQPIEGLPSTKPKAVNPDEILLRQTKPKSTEIPPEQVDKQSVPGSKGGLLSNIDDTEFKSLIEQRAKDQAKADEARMVKEKQEEVIKQQKDAEIARQTRLESYIKSSPYSDNPESVRIMRETLASHPSGPDDPTTAMIAESRAKEMALKNPVNTHPPTEITKPEQDLANKRGIAIESLDTLPSNIKGAEEYKSRQVKINPISSTESTVPHEVTHTFLDDLLKSTNPKNVKLGNDAIEFAKAAGYDDPYEYLADTIGEKIAKRLKPPTGPLERFQQWVGDVKTSFKYRFGDNRNLSPEVISMRALSDAPYGTRKDIINNESPIKTNVGQTLYGTHQDQRTSSGQDEQNRGRSADLDNRQGQSTNEPNQPEQSGARKDNDSSGNTVRTPDRGTVESSGPIREGAQSSNTPKGGGIEEITTPDKQTNRVIPPSDAEGGGIRYSTEKPGDQPEYKSTKGVPGIKSELDKIRDDKNLGPKREDVANGLTHLTEEFTRKRGEYHDSLLYDLRSDVGVNIRSGNPVDYLKGNSKVADRILNYADDINDKGSSNINLTNEEKSIYDKLRKHIDFLGSERNKRPGLRQGGIDPTYFPQNISSQAMDVIVNKPGTTEFTKLHNDYVDHVADQMLLKGKVKDLPSGQKAAESFWDGMLETFRSNESKPNIADQFGAIDKAEGFGLPKSMRENNLLNRVGKFSDRYARRIAYHDAIEDNPKVQDALFGKEGIAGAKSVRTVLDRLTGVRSKFDLGVEAASGLYNSFILGTAAGVRDVVTTPFLGAQNMTLFQTPLAAISSIKNLNKNWKETIKSGITPLHIGALESNDGASGYSGVTDLLRRGRDVSNEVQGRNYLERLARTMAYGIGKFTVNDNVNQFKKSGNLTGQRAKFMDDFGPKDWRNRPNFTEDLAQETAARFAESLQGTYGPKGLPSVVTDSHLAPFLALSRWNIEKFNNFVKYSIDPARKGNFTPLLNQTAYLLLGGGATIEALNELINKKKSKLPSIEEIKKTSELSGDTGKAVAYKLAGLASLSAYSGELGNLSKNLLDYHFGSRPRWYQYPVLEAATRGYQYLPQLADAIAEKDLHKFSEIVSDMMESNIQTYRVLLRQASKGKQDELLHQDNNRDLRLFKTLMGYPTGDIPSDQVEDYSKLYSREFHQADTVDEISKSLPGAIKEVTSKSSTPEEIKSGLRGLKLSGGRIFPDIDTNPSQAGKYYRFLGDRGKSRFAEDLRIKEINKIKSGLVPKI